ncbi:MAG: ShlB/FhaC/HecB family hemolysin secretion/activation protein [Anderseniella sp.]
MSRVVVSLFAVALLFVVADSTLAQVPAGVEAGRVDQRFEERRDPTVRPRITRGLESTTPPAEAALVKLMLRSVKVEGATVYTDSDFSAFYQEYVGQEVTLQQVFSIAAKITAKYGQDGFLLSRAIVPPQELNERGANIRIIVIEGYVDEVRWPEGLERFRDFFTAYADAITSERPLNNRTLERYLLLANDLPGLKFETSLVASTTTPNASTLIVTVEEDRFDGYVSLDNHGVEASGPYQATIGLGANNLLGIHERVEIAFTGGGPSEDDEPELLYLEFKYKQVLNAEGLTFFTEGNVSRGDPGTAPLLALGLETEGSNISTGFIYPFIRTRDENLNGTIAFDFKNSESENLGVPATEDRLRIVRAGLDYERADQKGGINQFQIEASKGIEGLGSTKNGNILASRTPGVVDFFKLTGLVARTQQLPKNFSLYGEVFGQWSPDALLSSQECGYGGRSRGRGFDSSIITGDRCVMATLELRKNIALQGQVATLLTYVQPYAFADIGKIWNETPPLGTPADDRGASIGAGLRFGNEKFSADLAVTRVVETPDSQPGVDDVNGWFKVTARF